MCARAGEGVFIAASLLLGFYVRAESQVGAGEETAAQKWMWGQFPSSINAVHALQYSMGYRTVLTSGKKGYCYSVLFSAQVPSLQDPKDSKGKKSSKHTTAI